MAGTETKVSVEIDFGNAARCEDFMEAAEQAGLSPADYLLVLIEKDLAELERGQAAGDVDNGKRGVV